MCPTVRSAKDATLFLENASLLISAAPLLSNIIVSHCAAPRGRLAHTAVADRFDGAFAIQMVLFDAGKTREK